MRAAIHIGRHEHHRTWGTAMQAGLRRHGIDARLAGFDAPEPCDFAVVWGARQRQVFDAGRPVLVMERGHVGDRMAWTSCGWGGIGRRGRYPEGCDDGQRWAQHHGHLMQGWKAGGGYALIIGQVENDQSIGDLDVAEWATDCASHLGELGWNVRFRPHPLAPRWPTPAGLTVLRGTLEQAFADAGLCVTFNSTTGVEAVLAGVPTVTLDEGAMAWPVAGHALSDVLRPRRWPWASDLAWTQWTVEEVAQGEAWGRLGALLPEFQGAAA